MGAILAQMKDITMSLNLDEDSLRNIVRGVIAQMSNSPKCGKSDSSGGSINSCASSVSDGKNGIFTDVKEAAAAAYEGFKQLSKGGMDARRKVIDIVKKMVVTHAKEWGEFEYNETKIGRLDHKIGKLEIVSGVPGVEWIRPDAYSGDHGIMLEEYAPYGVIGSITPLTHSIPTISGNIINMVAAGNSVVFNPHPGGVKSAVLAISAFNREIEKQLGISNLICCMANPTLDSFDAICKSDIISIMCITGGPGVVKAAMKSGKKSICAGPGNPPVIVDDTVNLDKAASDVIAGGAFDNNLLCVGEKEVFVLDSAFDGFMKALKNAGAYQISGSSLDRLTDAAFARKDGHWVLKRELVGKDPWVLAEAAGFSVPQNTNMLFAETDAEHPFVVEEQMMPMLPVVRVKSFDEALAAAKNAEHNYRHSAIIHSLDVTRMTAMARELNTTVFVKNGPSTAGLGLGGEGYLSYSIATTTGEGISNPKTFTRRRRCVMVDNLNIF